MNRPLSNSQTRDAEALLHPFTDAPALRRRGALVIERGEGIRVYDDRGRPYIEAMAGLWCAGLGFGNAELIEAAARQFERLPFYHLFVGRSHEPALELAERIKALAPGPMARVIFQSSGSEANDTQIKLAWFYNNALGRREKKKVISRKRGYHGVTIVSGSLTGLDYVHEDFDLPVGFIRHLTAPHYWKEARPDESEADFTARLAGELRALIETEGPGTIAAFIAEPVMGAGGVVPPPAGYFEAVGAICREHDILMIADEVITGFGRTGHWFGSQAVGFEPTSISMAKQLTASYFPLSAIAMNREMAEVIEAHTGKLGTLGHGFTYGGHPVGCAVGAKALEIYERLDMPAHVRRVGRRFADHLERLGAHPLVGEVRHAGLMGALELVPDKASRGFARPGEVGSHMADEMLARGVICRPAVDAMVFCPPMIITGAEIDELFDGAWDALDATLDWAKSEGHVG